jgi:hypothetical protein
MLLSPWSQAMTPRFLPPHWSVESRTASNIPDDDASDLMSQAGAEGLGQTSKCTESANADAAVQLEGMVYALRVRE